MKKTFPFLFVMFLLPVLVALVTAGGGNSITTLDTVGEVGLYTSLELDAAGNPVISYMDASNYDLKLIHCNDPNCAGGDESIISPVTEGLVGYHTSLKLDSAGNPVVSFGNFAAILEYIYILHCNDPNCAGGDESLTTPDFARGSTQSSLALDMNGYPVVSFLGFDDDLNHALNILHCNDPNCAGDDESITSPVLDISFMRDTSLVLDSQGFPVVSFAASEDLYILHCNDPNCAGNDDSLSSPDTTEIVGAHNSLALDSNGYPVVSYQYQDDTGTELRVMHCNDPNCVGGDESITGPDTDGNVGFSTSLILDSNGYPIVSYGLTLGPSSTYDLKILYCNDPNCAGGDESITIPDGNGAVGFSTSIELDDAGHPVVSYRDVQYDDLKLLHCGNPTCAGGPGPTPTTTTTPIPPTSTSTSTPTPTSTSTPTTTPTMVPTNTPTSTQMPTGTATATKIAEPFDEYNLLPVILNKP